MSATCPWLKAILAGEDEPRLEMSHLGWHLHVNEFKQCEELVKTALVNKANGLLDRLYNIQQKGEKVSPTDDPIYIPYKILAYDKKYGKIFMNETRTFLNSMSINQIRDSILFELASASGDEPKPSSAEHLAISIQGVTPTSADF